MNNYPKDEYLSPLAALEESETANFYPQQPSHSGKWNNQSPSPNSKKPYQREASDLREGYRSNIVENDSGLPAELRGLFFPLKCLLCKCEMSAPLVAKSHYQGKKHTAAVKKWFNDHPEHSDKYKPPEKEEKVLDEEKLYCKYCDITLGSEKAAESHYLGRKHQKVINSNVMKNAFFNQNTGQWVRCETAKEDKTGRFGIGLAFAKVQSNEAPVIGHKFYCETCEVACPSQITLNQHLLGSQHKKKSASKVPINEALKFYCETCEVACPSQHTLNEHLLGSKHKKKLAALPKDAPPPATKDNILESVIQNERKSPPPTDLSIYRTPSGCYYCKPCDVTLNSEAQFLQHSQSKKHVKNISGGGNTSTKPKN